jgi:hypothetical protein
MWADFGVPSGGCEDEDELLGVDVERSRDMRGVEAMGVKSLAFVSILPEGAA